MPIYHVQAPNLEKYTTTEKDAARGISRMPPMNQRVYTEDLFTEKKNSRRPTVKEIEILDQDGEVDQAVTKDEWDDKIRRRSKQVKAGFESKYRLSGKDKDLTPEQN